MKKRVLIASLALFALPTCKAGGEAPECEAAEASEGEENGRITLMWCAFAGAPNTVRVQRKGRAHLLRMPEFDELDPHFPTYHGAHAIAVVEATCVSDSRGYAVPRYEYQNGHDTLLRWAEKQGPDGLKEHRSKRNVVNLDGLPAFGPNES